MAEGEDETGTFDSVLFDLFGTLVDFRSTFDRTLHRIVREHGLEAKADVFRKNWNRFVFKGELEGSFITVHEDFVHGLSATLKALGAVGELTSYSNGVIGDLFKDLRVATLFPEVEEVLGSLDDANMRWAVVSNIDERDLQAILGYHGLKPYIAISSEAVRAYKPDPRPFQAAIEELGVPRERTLHVGDSPKADIHGASEFGLVTAWVNRYGLDFPKDLDRPRWELNDLKPVPQLVLQGSG
jgi:2-haloalkanoic acid dehalogenase type II